MLDLVRVDHVFPPVVGDAVGFAGGFGDVVERPEVVGAHVAAPVVVLLAVEDAMRAARLGKIPFFQEQSM